MPGRARVMTFFVVQVPARFTPRVWGRKFRETYGFDYDNQPRHAGELLVWPSEIPAETLAHNLRTRGVPFRTFRANPERMFHVQG